MTKSLITLAMAGLFALTACTEGNNTGGATVAGATAGALLGAAAFSGSDAWLGIVGSALVGGLAGYGIGKYMDRQDQANMATALSKTPQGKQATWTNPKSDITYTVVPKKNYHNSEGQYCREYQTTITVGGEEQKAYGRACRQPDGQWKIVSSQ